MDKDMNKNLKDTNSPLPNLPLIKGEEKGGGLSYSKTSKLITALYMVTDILDKEEPIRNKLRSLGMEIISDTLSVNRSNLVRNIEEVLSLLDIALTMNMISEMNKNILNKEFTQLKNSLIAPQDNPLWLEEFLADHPLLNKEGGGGDNSLITTSPLGLSSSARRRENYKGHTRIGVQKAGTLMKVLSDKTQQLSDRNFIASNRDNSNMARYQRRHNILNIIRNNQGVSSIKDIRMKINNETQGEPAFSEKTLQRELIAMTKEGVLNKTGEKRWSRYFIK